jgi:hypothetical protein
MKRIFEIYWAMLLAILIVSCEAGDLDLQDNPNDLTPDKASADLILNDIQLDFKDVWNRFNGVDRGLIRHENQFGTYANAVNQQTLALNSDPWAKSYAMFNNIDLLIEISDRDELPYHRAMAKFMKAYTLTMLVDHYGNVPLTQANNPEEFPNPATDKDEDIYAAALDLMDEALEDLEMNTIKIPNLDFFYDGSRDQWIKAINSFKLKIFLTIKGVDPNRASNGINQILSSNSYIKTIDEDFDFRFSNNGSPVESRHPQFTSNYLASFASDFMSNDFLEIIKNEKFNLDPRLRYYMLRQTSNAPSGSNLPCAGNANFNYCYTGDLYWGRDHKDDSGIPNDRNLRTTWGIYPAGGGYDRGDESAPGSFTNVAQNQGLGGAGILPMWSSSFTYFSLAEASLTLGTQGNPATYLQLGIQRSFEKVADFSGIAMNQSEMDNYLNEVMASFLAASDSEKLEIVMKEFYIALFGNGLEAYNNYRRTGLPEFPLGVATPTEQYPRTYVYPINAIRSNTSLVQKKLADQVFWDVLEANAIN